MQTLPKSYQMNTGTFSTMEPKPSSLKSYVGSHSNSHQEIMLPLSQECGDIKERETLDCKEQLGQWEGFFSRLLLQGQGCLLTRVPLGPSRWLGFRGCSLGFGCFCLLHTASDLPHSHSFWPFLCPGLPVPMEPSKMVTNILIFKSYKRRSQRSPAYTASFLKAVERD